MTQILHYTPALLFTQWWTWTRTLSALFLNKITVLAPSFTHCSLQSSYCSQLTSLTPCTCTITYTCLSTSRHARFALLYVDLHSTMKPGQGLYDYYYSITRLAKVNQYSIRKIFIRFTPRLCRDFPVLIFLGTCSRRSLWSTLIHHSVTVWPHFPPSVKRCSVVTFYLPFVDLDNNQVLYTSGRGPITTSETKAIHMPCTHWETLLQTVSRKANTDLLNVLGTQTHRSVYSNLSRCKARDSCSKGPFTNAWVTMINNHWLLFCLNFTDNKGHRLVLCQLCGCWGWIDLFLLCCLLLFFFLIHHPFILSIWPWDRLSSLRALPILVIRGLKTGGFTSA